MTTLPQKIRKDFPLLYPSVNDRSLIYLDFASTGQVPRPVLQSMEEYYTTMKANVHRGVYKMSEQATIAYEGAHEVCARFLGCNNDEVVLTSGTTESINLLSIALSETLKPGDEILLSIMEHHSNLVPWQQAAKRTGASLRFIPLAEDGRLDLRAMERFMTSRTKIVSICHASNVLGTINPIKQIADLAHAVSAIFIVDGAQSAGHQPVNVRNLDADFFVCSGHKMYGPTGTGILYGRRELLDRLEPPKTGGDMILSVTKESATWNDLPWKWEAGTPNIAGAIGLSAAVQYIGGIGVSAIEAHETALTSYAINALKQIDGLNIKGPQSSEQRTAVISFDLRGVHPHDLATLLDRKQICVRAGHHCAMPLMNELGVRALTRMSFGMTTTRGEIDRTAEALKEIQHHFQA